MLGVWIDVLPALLGPGRSPTASLGRFHRPGGVLILSGELTARYRIGLGPAVSDRPDPSSVCSLVIGLQKLGSLPSVCWVIWELIYRGQTGRLVGGGRCLFFSVSDCFVGLADYGMYFSGDMPLLLVYLMGLSKFE